MAIEQEAEPDAEGGYTPPDEAGGDAVRDSRVTHGSARIRPGRARHEG